MDEPGCSGSASLPNFYAIIREGSFSERYRNSPRVGGSKGPEPLASPNVLHWVGWLPGTTRCAAGPAVPASHGAPHGRCAGGGKVGRDRIATTPQCPAVERFTVGAGHSGFPTGGGNLRSLRGKSVQAAFRGVLVCQGMRKSSLPGKARGFRGADYSAYLTPPV